MPTHYEILGVEPSADHTTIKLAHRKKIIDLHTDTNKNPDDLEMCKLVNASWTVLKDSESRRMYDVELNIHAIVDAYMGKEVASRVCFKGPIVRGSDGKLNKPACSTFRAICRAYPVQMSEDAYKRLTVLLELTDVIKKSPVGDPIKQLKQNWHRDPLTEPELRAARVAFGQGVPVFVPVQEPKMNNDDKTKFRQRTVFVKPEPEPASEPQPPRPEPKAQVPKPEPQAQQARPKAQAPQAEVPKPKPEPAPAKPANDEIERINSVRRFDGWHSVYGEIFVICRDSETSHIGLDAILAKAARKERKGDISPCFANLLRECIAELKLNPRLILSDKEFQEDYAPLDDDGKLVLPSSGGQIQQPTPTVVLGGGNPPPPRRRDGANYTETTQEEKNKDVRQHALWAKIYTAMMAEKNPKLRLAALEKNPPPAWPDGAVPLATEMMRRLLKNPEVAETDEFKNEFAPL